ncbi:type II secretion system protein [Hydrogenimonas sp.]
MRRAFSMIELVVSIVVIGIAFMSVPLIMSETSKSVEVSIKQEAVMAALTQMVNIMSYKWDEQQTDESVNGSYAKVLDTYSLAQLQCYNYAEGRRRVGHFVGDGRRKCYNTPREATPAANLGSDGGDMDDIDDIIGDSTLLSGTDAPFEDYKKEYGSSITVVYVDDNISNSDFSPSIISGSIHTAATATRTNIKMIETTISSAEDDKEVVLRAFAANIGEIKYYTRRVQ